MLEIIRMITRLLILQLNILRFEALTVDDLQEQLHKTFREFLLGYRPIHFLGEHSEQHNYQTLQYLTTIIFRKIPALVAAVFTRVNNGMRFDDSAIQEDTCISSRGSHWSK